LGPKKFTKGLLEVSPTLQFSEAFFLKESFEKGELKVKSKEYGGRQIEVYKMRPRKIDP